MGSRGTTSQQGNGGADKHGWVSLEMVRSHGGQLPTSSKGSFSLLPSATPICIQSLLSTLGQISHFALDFPQLLPVGCTFDTLLPLLLFPIWMYSCFFLAICYRHTSSASLTITRCFLLQWAGGDKTAPGLGWTQEGASFQRSGRKVMSRLDSWRCNDGRWHMSMCWVFKKK